jgi:hypothetical protein
MPVGQSQIIQRNRTAQTSMLLVWPSRQGLTLWLLLVSMTYSGSAAIWRILIYSDFIERVANCDYKPRYRRCVTKTATEKYAGPDAWFSGKMDLRFSQ